MTSDSIDIGLARYSDWAFTTSLIVLVMALMLLAVELASSRGRRVEARELVFASAGAGRAPADPLSVQVDADRPGVVIQRPAPSRVLAFVVVKAPHRGFAPYVPARAREGAACDAEHAGALEEEFRRLPARHRGALCTAVESESQVKSTQL